MGRAASALGTGPDVLIWNPALLARADRAQASLFHSDLYTDATTFQSGFMAYPTIDFGTFAVGIQRLGVGGIDGRDDRNIALGDFDVSELHTMVGYGHHWSTGFAAGANLKLVQQSVDGTSATGTGVDLGLAFERPLPATGHFFDAGLVIQNAIAPSLRLDEEEVSDPRRVRLGVGHRWAHPLRRVQSALAFELEWPDQADSRWGTGAELSLDQTFFLRGGLDNGNLTAGFGLQVRGVEFAYAMRGDEDLPRDDRFSLSVAFGRSVAERQLERREKQESEVSDRLAALLASREDEALRDARAAASSAVEQGDHEQAILLYGRVLLLDPEDVEASRHLDDARRLQALEEADIELAEGSAARAGVDFQRVLDSWPGDVRATQGLRKSRETSATAENRRATLSELFTDAIDRYAAGDLSGASAALNELLRLEPMDEAALKLVDRVEASRQERVVVALSRSDAELERGAFDSALGWLDRARALAPERSEEWSARNEQILSQKQMARDELLAAHRASAVKTPVMSTAEVDPALLDRAFDDGMRAFEAGDYAGAARSWRSLWMSAPDHGRVAESLVKAYQLLGIQAYTDGDYAYAIEQCRYALEIDPDNEKSRRYLARIEEERVSIEEIDSRRSDR